MSWQMHAIATYGRLIRRPRTYATPQRARAYLERPKTAGGPPSQLANSAHYQLTLDAITGFDCYTVQASSGVVAAAPRASVVYVHGGAYVNQIQRARWKLVRAIADADPVPGTRAALRACAATLCRRSYRLVVNSYLAGAMQQGPVYIAGDSSGAGLALAGTQAAIVAGNTPPLGLTLISPWLDIALTNPAIAPIAKRDPWLAVPGLRECGRVWARHLAADDSRVSPIHGELQEPSTDRPLRRRPRYLRRRLPSTARPCRRRPHHLPRATWSNSRLPAPSSPRSQARTTCPTQPHPSHRQRTAPQRRPPPWFRK